MNQYVVSLLRFAFVVSVVFFSLCAQARSDDVPTTVGKSTPSCIKLADHSIDVDGDNVRETLTLGDLRSGLAYEFRVAIRNHTSHSLKPEEIRSSCNCTAGTIKEETIVPGGTGTLMVKVLAPKKNGEFRQRVGFDLSSSDGRKLSLEINLAGDSKDTLVISPNPIEIVSDKVTQVTTLIKSPFEGIQILGCDVKSLSRDVVVESTTVNGKGTATVKLAVSPRQQGGVRSDILYVKADIESDAVRSQIESEVQISIVEPDDWKIAPSNLLLVWSEKESCWTAKLFVFSPLRKPLATRFVEGIVLKAGGNAEDFKISLANARSTAFGAIGYVEVRESRKSADVQNEEKSIEILAFLESKVPLRVTGRFDIP